MPPKNNTKHGKREVRDAIAAENGVIAAIAARLAVTRQTVYSYLDKFDLWGEIEAGRDRIYKLAQRNVSNAVEEGDLDTSKWVVSRLGKNDGWAQRSELTGADGAALVLSPDTAAAMQRLNLTPEQLAGIVEEMVQAEAAEADAAQEGDEDE